MPTKKKTQKKKASRGLLSPKAAPRKAKSAEPVPKEFLDIIAPGAARFNTDHYVLGNSFRTVFALRGYPTSTEELALLRHLGEKSGVTLSVYARKVDPAEERKIIHNAANKNRMNRANTNDMKATITAEANLQDVANLIASMHKNREPLMHCAVFIELSARSQEGLHSLQNEVLADLVRSKLSADRVFLRQREGFRAVNPAGWNCLESGKTVIALDPEHELVDLSRNLGGCFIDLMSGRYIINPLEPKVWDVDGEDDEDAPATFRQHSRLSQHISFLKDFFRAYKDFSDRHIDAIELMLEALYRKWGINDNTDFTRLKPTDYPILSALYAVIEESYQNYDAEPNPLYPKELLQEVLLLYEICENAAHI